MEATLLPPAGKAADPYACIGTKNAKHVQNCLELYMNDRGIDYLPEGVFEAGRAERRVLLGRVPQGTASFAFPQASVSLGGSLSFPTRPWGYLPDFLRVSLSRCVLGHLFPETGCQLVQLLLGHWFGPLLVLDAVPAPQLELDARVAFARIADILV